MSKKVRVLLVGDVQGRFIEAALAAQEPGPLTKMREMPDLNPTQVGHASLVEQSLRILEPEEPLMDSSAWDDLEDPIVCAECGKDGEMIFCEYCPRGFCSSCLDRHEERRECR